MTRYPDEALTEERLDDLLVNAVVLYRRDDAATLVEVVAELRRLRALVEQATHYDLGDGLTVEPFGFEDGDRWGVFLVDGSRRLPMHEGGHFHWTVNGVCADFATALEAVAAAEKWRAVERASKGENRG